LTIKMKYITAKEKTTVRPIRRPNATRGDTAKSAGSCVDPLSQIKDRMHVKNMMMDLLRVLVVNERRTASKLTMLAR
jgi:hypothetical protein